MHRLPFLVWMLAPATTFAADVQALIKNLDDPARAPSAHDELVGLRDAALPELIAGARSSGSLSRRGWCITALSKIGGARADDALRALHEKNDEEMLVRTWAVAARVHVAPNLEAILKLAPLSASFPAIQRPLGMRLLAEASKKDNDPAKLIPSLLSLMQQNPQLQQTLLETVLGFGPDPLLRTMLTAPDPNARFMAASFAATLGQRERDRVVKATLPLYAFDPKASAVPWAGGPLYIPSLQYQAQEARLLVDGLLGWMIFAAEREKAEEVNQVLNNLRSVGLMGMAGIAISWSEQTPADWLRTYKKSLGKAELEKLLAKSGAGAKKFRPIVEEP